jgi:segregation and condensation protein A
MPAPSEGIARAATCAVKLPAFEGPLDLLLHLCRANEVDITDLPIALISEQYVEYLELMRMLDIDVAAEYLLMAATLAHIKSRMLLPGDPESDAEEGIDPRAELARRLAEYAVFQEAARDLGERPRLGRDVFEGFADRSHVPEPEPQLVVSLFSLVEAMQRVLARIPEEERHHQVQLERISLQERMVYVMDRLRERPGLSVLFEDLLVDGGLTRARVVVTFLSLLELAKIQALLIFQNLDPEGVPHGPVRVRLTIEGAPDDAQISQAAERADAELAERVDLADVAPHSVSEEPTSAESTDSTEES